MEIVTFHSSCVVAKLSRMWDCPLLCLGARRDVVQCTDPGSCKD